MRASQKPAHAGKLFGWERLAFGLVFALMASFVLVVTIASARSGHFLVAEPATNQDYTFNRANLGTGSSTDRTASLPQVIRPNAGADGALGSATSDTIAIGTARGDVAGTAQLDRKLAAALAPILARSAGHITIGVIDVTTGARAVYDGQRRFRTAGIENADILAGLLLDAQHHRIQLAGRVASLAARMIEDGSGLAAARLYDIVKGRPGLAEANAELGLTHTWLGSARHRDFITTVADQLRLLTDLTAARSPLAPAGRAYELGLMENVQSSQAWGVAAAASAGTTFAVKDGWVHSQFLWVTDSFGVVEHDGQQLLVVVAATGEPTRAAGIRADSSAAAAAAAVITA